MVDVRIPTTDGNELVLSRYTPREAKHCMLFKQLRLTLPQQPPPKITAKQVRKTTSKARHSVVENFSIPLRTINYVALVSVLS